MQYRLEEFRRNQYGPYYMFATAKGGEKLQFNDVFNVKDLMTDMHDWLVDQGWATRDDKAFPEIFYHHKWMQNGMEELRWRWRCGVPPTGDGAGFFHYIFNINVRILTMKRTEIMRHERKYKTMEGDLEIECEGVLLMDAKHKWRNHALLKHFLDLYLYRIKHEDVLWHRNNLRVGINRFFDHCKAYFKMPRFRAETETVGWWGKTSQYD